MSLSPAWVRMRAPTSRVAADLRPLLVVERAGLVQDGVGDGELADVVQDARRSASARRGRGGSPAARRCRARSRRRSGECRAVPASRRSSVSASSSTADRWCDCARVVASQGLDQRLQRGALVDDAAVAAELLGGEERARRGAQQRLGAAQVAPGDGHARRRSSAPTAPRDPGPRPAAAPRRPCRAPAASVRGSSSANSSPPSRAAEAVRRAAPRGRRRPGAGAPRRRSRSRARR